MPNLEIKPGRALSTAIAYGGYNVARLDPVTDVSVETLIVAVETHIALPMVDDNQQAVATHPIGKRNASV